MRHTPDLSRRRLLGGGLAVVATLGASTVLAGCGSEDSSETTGDTGVSADEGPWTWTDGIGQEIELDQRPTRIAAYGDQAAVLLAFGITPVAIFHYIDPADDPAFDDLDISDIPVVGTTIGELDLERLLGEIAPDLILTVLYEGDTPDTLYGFKDKAQIDTIRSQVPIGGVLQTGSAIDLINTNEDLVGLLGIDTTAGQVAEDRAEFEAASAELSEAAKSGLTVLPVYAEDANLYYNHADDEPSMAYYKSLGVQFTELAGEDYYWEVVSWEKADTYQPDIFLYSLRGSYTTEQFGEQPVFARLGAYQDDQLHPWKFKSMDYPSQTSYMRELAGWLTSDRKVQQV